VKQQCEMTFKKQLKDKIDVINDEPSAHTSLSTHAKVFALLLKEKPGIIFDAPAGEGYASKRLKELGFEVYAADLDEKDFKLRDIQFDRIDLNNVLPYRDAFFNYIMCIEGIEHIENPHHLIREFSRILKKGGKLIISTPNILSVYSRLRYLLSGYADWIHSRINLPKEKKTFDLMEQHINMIGFPELHYVLSENGFEIETLTSNHSTLTYSWGKLYVKPFAMLSFYVIGICIKIYNMIFKKIILSEYLVTKDMLYGESIIVKAKKIS
jgi:SAM-dependent methyltransferase